MYELHKDASKSYLPNSHIVLEQCTGLKDKNGKLIYEGDILDFDLSIPKNGGHHRGIVYWQKQNNLIGWMISSLKHTGSWDIRQIAHPNSWMTWAEVIGNIHENPELLEDTTNCSQLNEVVTNCNQSEVDK